MFADDGHLIGITISNSKDDTYQLIYPNINMSVPVYEILPILQQYGETKGNLIIHIFYIFTFLLTLKQNYISFR